MKTRVYGVGAVEIIRREVESTGRSDGWSPPPGEGMRIAALVESQLRAFDVGYVDDMTGGWARVPGGSTFFADATALEPGELAGTPIPPRPAVPTWSPLGVPGTAFVEPSAMLPPTTAERPAAPTRPALPGLLETNEWAHMGLALVLGDLPPEGWIGVAANALQRAHLTADELEAIEQILETALARHATTGRAS
jgi:hypothetical protein